MASISKTVRPKRSNNNAVSPPGLGLTVGRGTPTVAGTGNTGWRANEPPGLTAIGGLNYSQTVPAGWGNERFLAAPDQAWSVITDANLANNGSNFSQATDASAPRSPSAVWQVHVEPGTWTQGHTVARMGRQLGLSATTVYACFSVKWDVGFPFNTISTKMFQWSPGTLLCQARHGSNYLRCSSEDIGQDYDAFIVDGSQPTLGVWHIVEVLFIRGNPGTVKVWLDGAIRTDCTSLPVAPSAPLTEFFNSCHLGGGGMTITADSYMWYDEIYLSGA